MLYERRHPDVKILRVKSSMTHWMIDRNSNMVVFRVSNTRKLREIQ